MKTSPLRTCAKHLSSPLPTRSKPEHKTEYIPTTTTENEADLYGISTYADLSLNLVKRKEKCVEIIQPFLSETKNGSCLFVHKIQPSNSGFLTEPTFWLCATNKDTIKRMQQGVLKGMRYFIPIPFCEEREGRIFLPIIVEEPRCR